MRDPERIERTISALKRIWKKQPDLRLGQLVVIAAKPTEPCPAVFHTEDDTLLQGLLDYELQIDTSKP